MQPPLAAGVAVEAQPPRHVRYKQKIRAAQRQGYTVVLLFWLNNPELAQERVKTRVLEAGHSIAPEVIDRRYWLGINCLFANYLPLVDEASVYDNSSGEPILLVQKLADGFYVKNETLYNQLRAYEAGRTA
jgi:predicted ABC-type ATPase